MSFTRILPTDKHGQIYHGPRTWKRVEERAEAIWDDSDSKSEVRSRMRVLANELIEHGYTGLTRRLTTTYDLEE